MKRLALIPYNIVSCDTHTNPTAPRTLLKNRDNELVKTNMFHYLRQAMPSPKYLITFTVGGIATAPGTPQQVQNAFSPPLANAYASSGVALPTIRQNINDIDFIQLMTCMSLVASPASSHACLGTVLSCCSILLSILVGFPAGPLSFSSSLPSLSGHFPVVEGVISCRYVSQKPRTILALSRDVPPPVRPPLQEG